MLNQKYGQQVSIEYIDILDEEKMELYPDASAVITAKKVSALPLVAFDGAPVWMGSLSYPHLVGELGKRGVVPLD